MKKRRRLNTNCLLLLIGLAAGIWLGYNFVDWQIKIPPSPTATPFPTIAGQRRLLVIGVDQLSASPPALKGVWYVTYFPDKPVISLVPLYPAIHEPFRARNKDLAETFRLDKSGGLSEGFFTVLEDTYKDITGEPVLFDDTALISLINMLGGVEINGQMIDGEEAVGNVLDPQLNLDDAFAGQATLLKGLCQGVSNQKRHWQPSDLLKIIPGHMRTGFDIDQALADWASLNDTGAAITCEIHIPGQDSPR